MAVNAPSIEAVTEFTVDTNGFKAEFGQASGGIMSFASKSGTNSHSRLGLRFRAQREVRRQQLLQQRPRHPARRFTSSTISARPSGGPVWIPKIYNGKNRTFFFLSYEAFRNRDGANGIVSTVPTAEMYDGDFHNWVNQPAS